MLSSGLVVEVGDALPTQEGTVYVMGREVDTRTRSLIYPLTVSRSTGGSYTIEKTFADAEALNEALKQRFASLPAFPRKRHITHFFMYSEKSDYWNALREGLQEYFNALLEQDRFLRDPSFTDFLQQGSSRLPSPLSVSLDDPTRCQESGDYEYGVTVSNSHFNAKHRLEWSVKKLHSEFVAFDERMRKRFPDKELPSFPRKRHVSHLLMHGSEDGWYRAQAVEIETYLNRILSDDQLQGASMVEDSCVRELLGISDARLKIANRCIGWRGSKEGAVAPSSAKLADPGITNKRPEGTQSSSLSTNKNATSALPDSVNSLPLLQEWPQPSSFQASSFDHDRSSHCESVRSRLAGCCRSIWESLRKVFRR